MLSLETYKSKVECAWCPGCGNFGILSGLKNTLVKMGLHPHEVAVFTGIGQAPKLPHYMKVNTFNGLHGREIAAAEGFKLARPDMVVLVHGGEGGLYGEGGNHFLHGIRRNLDITVVVHDNHIYGLTKGQASPTTVKGTVTKLNPHGVMTDAMNPLALAISQSCSFVAQSFSGNSGHLSSILEAAINHKGFSYINVLQPCVTWDKVHNYKYFQENTEILDEDWDSKNLIKAIERVTTPGKLPLGIIYKNNRKSYDEILSKKVKVDFNPDKIYKLMKHFI